MLWSGIVEKSEVRLSMPVKQGRRPWKMSGLEEEDSMFGKVLASGNGKNNSEISKTLKQGFVVFGILFAIVCVLFYKIRENENSTMSFFNADHIQSNYILAIGVLAAAVIIFIIGRGIDSIKKTKITVYEKGVVGTGFGKYHWGDIFSLYDFQLVYDNIGNVDTTKTYITIYASGSQYVCFVENPVAIQRIISQQQLVHQQSKG